MVGLLTGGDLRVDLLWCTGEVFMAVVLVCAREVSNGELARVPIV